MWGVCVCSALCVTWSLPLGRCFRGKGPCPVLVTVQPVHSRQRQRLAELWAQGHQGAGAAQGGEARPPDRGHHNGESGRARGAVFKPSAETDCAGAFRSCAGLCNREAQGSTLNHSPLFSVAGSGGDEAVFPAACGGYPPAPTKALERADVRGAGAGTLSITTAFSLCPLCVVIAGVATSTKAPSGKRPGSQRDFSPATPSL